MARPTKAETNRRIAEKRRQQAQKAEKITPKDVIKEEPTVTVEPETPEATVIPEEPILDAGPAKEFNPIDEPVIERAYAGAGGDTNFTEKEINTPIETPKYEAPPPDDTQQQAEKKLEDKQFNDTLRNPEYDNLSPAEQSAGSELLVDTCLDGYVELHSLARLLIKVGDDRLQQIIADDEFDLDMPFPLPTGTIPVIDFIQEYNNQVDKIFVVEDSFIAKVRPPMIRVFNKHGWALSDEMFLMITFGKDIAVKGTMAFGLKKSINNAFKQLSLIYKQGKQVEIPMPPKPEPEKAEEETKKKKTKKDDVEEVEAEVVGEYKEPEEK